MTPLTFNNTIINDSTTMIPNMVSNSNDLSQGYFGLFVMVAVFIIIFWKSFKQTGDIKMDFVRSLLVSSGMTASLGFIGIISNVFTSYVHFIWFFTLFIITIIWLFFLKKKGF